MKALKSKLASEVLADPNGRVALRDFLVTKSSSPATRVSDAGGRLQFLRGDSSVVVNARVVPKAKAG